jgi:hypothetical protein
VIKLNPGRKPYTPSDDDRLKVSRMASVGMTQAQIAKVFSMTPKTLRKHYRTELDASAIEANLQVAETLFKMATSGNNTAASIFWARTRLRFTSLPTPEPTKPSAPTPPSTIVVLGKENVS